MEKKVSPHEIYGSFKGSRYYLFSTVKGLSSEEERFKRSYTTVAPDAVALPVSPSGLHALREYHGEPISMTTPERIYAKHLSMFGEVRIPHPVYLKCLEYAGEDMIPVYPLDMDEETYSECYTRFITGLEMIFSSMREKRLEHRIFKSKDPFEFAVEWDSAINSSKGYRQLEASREVFMADRLITILEKHHVVLAVVEHERLNGIIKHLIARTGEGNPLSR
jgi:hypothetical protein